MKSWPYEVLYGREAFGKEAGPLLSVLKDCKSLSQARERLIRKVSQVYAGTFEGRPSPPAHELIRARDCARALLAVADARSDARTGFSVTQAMWDVAAGRPREDLGRGFFAEMIHWVWGVQGQAEFQFLGIPRGGDGLAGREAAIARSEELDRFWSTVEAKMARIASGLTEDAQARRRARRQRICEILGASEQDWNDWTWQTSHIIKDAEALSRLVPLTAVERATIGKARRGRLPFAVTPYYASLMDEDDQGRDRAIRAQVIPPPDYVELMLKNRADRQHSCDFMLESDTSPIDLVTRRYPAIVILKPYNACPQICVYCQRNWEINEAMAPDALASEEQIESAIRWIEEHPAVREVLITGGDPLVTSDEQLGRILERVARIRHVDLIRIGTRTPVTVPMRITQELADLLGGFRQLGRRDIAVITHIEHPYELTIETARAVDRLRRAGIAVYNQLVYTFFVSRRFESAMLRMLLRRIGIDPYYTFVPKGKEETNAYRVPLARILQEQKEEARLMPGLRRADEAVYNVPGLGKNYLRAVQHRDLLTVMPDGSRMYEFHPWEKNLQACETYLARDVPILDYLVRLADMGENPDEYASIWYYF